MPSFLAWLESLKERLPSLALTQDEIDRIDAAPKKLNSAGFDDWGLHPETLKKVLPFGKFLYRQYFRAETHGVERVPAGRVMVVGNHGGQLPLDGLLLFTALAFDARPARIARGMVERWFPSLPFISSLFVRCGLMVGDPANCKALLEQDECVFVFPEGVRGSGKPFSKAYQLQRFGTGFVRLALEAKAPILPVGIVGSEETYPALFDFKALAKMMGMPYFPITPFFPFLGVLGAIPLPTRFQLRFGEPLFFDCDPDAPDAEIELIVEKVRASVAQQIEEGLRARGTRIFSVQESSES